MGSNPIFSANSRRNFFLFSLSLQYPGLCVVPGLLRIGFTSTQALEFNSPKVQFTFWGEDFFFPIMHHIIPGHIGSNSIQCGHFRFVWREHESSMFEGDNISRLWIPSLCKLCCSCWCFKSNPIWPIEICGQFPQSLFALFYVQFAFPHAVTFRCNNFCFTVSIFLFENAACEWRKICRVSYPAYLVFEESFWPACFIRSGRISQDDSFTSLIHDILKYLLKMICSFT